MSAIDAAVSQSQIIHAIRDAAKATGADFDYLLTTAQRESSLNPQAKSNTSSASGLFQFIERTWLDLVRRHGAEVGLADLSSQIKVTPDGRPSLADGQKMQEILALRQDPGIAAFMAGKLTGESRAVLEDRLGRQATGTELYLSHFFGAATAARFIETAEKPPHANSAALFPAQANANRSVFYHGDGTARSVAQVHAHLTKLHGDGSQPHQEPLTPGSNLHHGLFTTAMPSALPVQSLSPAPMSHASGSHEARHFILSPEVVHALIKLKLPPGAQTGDKDAASKF